MIPFSGKGKPFLQRPIFRWEGKKENSDKQYALVTRMNKTARRFLARKHFHEAITKIPHAIFIKINGAKGLPQASGMFGEVPQSSITVVNSFVRVGRKWRVYSAGETKVVTQSNDPTWDEHMRIIAVGEGKLVFNVMSRQIFASDEIVGQAILDLSKTSSLVPGSEQSFNLPLSPVKVLPCNARGVALVAPLPPTSPADIASKKKKDLGSLSFSVRLPNSFESMGAFFFEIQIGMAGFVHGEKKFVLLYDDKVNVFDTPFDTEPCYAFKCEEIEKIESAKFELTEIPMETIVITTKSGTVKRLAWGENGIRGMWMKALRKYMC